MKNKMFFSVALCTTFFLPSFIQVLPFGKDLGWASCSAQNVGINSSGATPDNSAILDLNTGNNFTSPNGKGLLIPRIALTGTGDITTIVSAAMSLLVYNTATISDVTPVIITGMAAHGCVLQRAQAVER